MSSGRPSSSAITKASGTLCLPLLIASAKSSRALSTASRLAAERSGKSIPVNLFLRHRILVRHLHGDENKIVPWRPHVDQAKTNQCRPARLPGPDEPAKFA